MEHLFLGHTVKWALFCPDCLEDKGPPVSTPPPLILFVWVVFHDDVLLLPEMSGYPANAYIHPIKRGVHAERSPRSWPILLTAENS